MNANDRLSRAVSAALRVVRSQSERLDDVDRFGAPAECFADVARGFDSELDEVLEEHGYASREELLLEVEARTSARWVYWNLPFSRDVL